MVTNEFYCTKCGKKGISLPRKGFKQKEAGHLKKLYCIYCQEEVNHVEIKSIGKYTYENFLTEFEMDNFTKDGNRKEDWKQCCAAAALRDMDLDN